MCVRQLGEKTVDQQVRAQPDRSREEGSGDQVAVEKPLDLGGDLRRHHHDEIRETGCISRESKTGVGDAHTHVHLEHVDPAREGGEPETGPGGAQETRSAAGTDPDTLGGKPAAWDVRSESLTLVLQFLRKLQGWAESNWA
eukprot:3139517-Rhodomonas_salina.1